ncbi:hypothetical protein [Mesorhizobium marinum]|uniref:Lipoprotein n=1 Tax=Mesorhizobium marinum TaxID=3228790 RepID=A0ABV3R4W4_9HYPH
MKTLNFGIAISALLLVAGCETSGGGGGAVAPGRATMGDVEKNCTKRLAQTANVSSSSIRVTDSTGSTEGSAVFLSLNGAPWVCRADGAGNITAVEFQGEG